MSKVDTNFPEVDTDLSKEKTDQSDETQDSLLQTNAGSRRLIPVIVALGASLLWLIAVSYYVLMSSGTALNTLGLSGLGSLVAGSFAPIGLFWLIALVFQRSDPLLERRLAIAQTLHKAIAPVEEAEKRLDILHGQISKELTNIDAVSLLAAERIDNLEDRFQEQVSNLFSATADTEAKTTTIRDTLQRERDAIETMSSDIESRFGNLETLVIGLTTAIQEASSSAHESADTALKQSTEQAELMKAAGDSLSDKLNKATVTMESRTEEAHVTADDLEERLTSVNDRISISTDFLKSEMNIISLESDKLAEQIKVQSETMAELGRETADQSERIEESLHRHAGEVSDAAHKAIGDTEEAASAFTEQAGTIARTVEAAIVGAQDKLNEAGATLDQHARHAEEVSDKIHASAMDQTKHTSEAVWERAEEINALLTSSMDRAASLLDEAGQKVADHGNKAEVQAATSSERVLQHMRQLQVGVEDQMKMLEAAAAGSKETLDSSVEAIAEEARKLAQQATDTSEEITNTGHNMDERMVFLSQTLQEMRAKIAHLESDLTTQQNSFEAASRGASDTIIAASDRFRQETSAIQDASERAGKSISDNAEHLKRDMESLNATSETASDHLAKSGNRLRKESEGLQSQLNTSSDALATAAEAFAGERSRIQGETGEVVAELSKATTSIGHQVEDLRNVSTEAHQTLQKATDQLTETTNETRATIDGTVNAASAHLHKTLVDMAGEAGDQVRHMEEDLRSTLGRLTAEYVQAGEQAGKEGATLAVRIGTEADRLTAQASRFLDKTVEIEKRIATSTRDDFARTSQLLLESLQSLSIDISKMLQHDIPDSAWQAYLDGDRSIFARRTLKIGTRAARKSIAEKFSTDGEFRENVGRFTRDFEGLMERAMLGDKGSALSVTLVSSDMGKLYILLAQSLKKIS